MKLLLHACCGPCAVKCVQSLKGEAIAPTLFYFNPNIHPFTEYEQRKAGLIAMAEQAAVPAIVHGSYGLRPFLLAVSPRFDSRCEACYRMRLLETAAFAKANGYDGFSTTLLISPYQNHELLMKAAQEAAAQFDVPFLYRDFRPRFREGQNAARAMGLYMQKYCGCIFSEEERYEKK